jgi:hypothetical protein
MIVLAAGLSIVRHAGFYLRRFRRGRRLRRSRAKRGQ